MTSTDLDNLDHLAALAEAANAAQDQPPDNHHAGMPEWTAVNDYFDSPLIGPESILDLIAAARLGVAWTRVEAALPEG